MNLVTGGTVASALTLLAGIANAKGYPAAGVFQSDPGTAVTMVASGLGALIAGVLAGAKKKPAA